MPSAEMPESLAKKKWCRHGFVRIKGQEANANRWEDTEAGICKCLGSGCMDWETTKVDPEFPDEPYGRCLAR
jgi:hypothetical protein